MNYIQDSNPFFDLLTVEGANHYGITNEDNLIQDRENIRPTIEQDIAIETIARWSGLFLINYFICMTHKISSSLCDFEAIFLI